MSDLTPTWFASHDAREDAIDLLPLHGRQALRQRAFEWCDLLELLEVPPPIGAEAHAGTPKDFGGPERPEIWLLWRIEEHDVLVVLGAEGDALILLGRSREGYPHRTVRHPADLQTFLVGPIEPRPTPPIRFLYRNHRGEIARRHVSPLSIRFGTAPNRPEPQWLLDAHDLDRDALRSFTLEGINRAQGERMACGHPEACRIWETGPHTFVPGEPEPEYTPTERCGWCEDVTRVALRSG